MRTIATVGIYQSSLGDFLEKLRRHHVAMVVDVRQRRGVRGPEYVLESLPDDAVSALLCVERDARACHRSLIAARLQAQFGMPVLNL
jgi:uncharacterized protein (DUF488 family)